MTKKLLFSVTKKDLKIEYYAAPGPGGQNKNKTKTACRITHIESGAIGNATEHRSQKQNQDLAFERMAKSVKFNNWIKIKSSEVISNKTIDEEVEESMSLENLKVEIQKDGKWDLWPL